MVEVTCACISSNASRRWVPVVWRRVGGRVVEWIKILSRTHNATAPPFLRPTQPPTHPPTHPMCTTYLLPAASRRASGSGARTSGPRPGTCRRRGGGKGGGAPALVGPLQVAAARGGGALVVWEEEEGGGKGLDFSGGGGGGLGRVTRMLPCLDNVPRSSPLSAPVYAWGGRVGG